MDFLTVLLASSLSEDSCRSRRPLLCPDLPRFSYISATELFGFQHFTCPLGPQNNSNSSGSSRLDHLNQRCTSAAGISSSSFSRSPMRTKSRGIGPVVASTTLEVGLVRRGSSSSNLSRARGGKRPLVRRIDSRTKKLTNVTADVARLREHLTRLQQLRDLLREKTMSRAETAVGSIPRLVHTYFNVFRNGYQPQVLSDTEHAGNLIHTDAFLFSIMDEEVLGGGFRGVHTLLEQWKRFTVLFAGLHLRLMDVVVVPLDSAEDNEWKVLVSATVAHSGHVTLKTIEILFPHILSDAALVMSILGRPVSGDGRTEFIFDCSTGRILECRIDIDMLGTFAPIVASPHDLAVLFKLAQLTSECFVGDKDCIPPGKAVPTAVSTTHYEAPINLDEPLTPTVSTSITTATRDDPMSLKNILTVEDLDYASDGIEMRAVNIID